MRLFWIMSLSLLPISFAAACPELQGIDLSAELTESSSYEVLNSRSASLTEEEFYSMPNWRRSSKVDIFARCKDTMLELTLRSLETGRVFQAVVSSDDSCDGGNVIGALYSENRYLRLGSIGDSFVSCD